MTWPLFVHVAVMRLITWAQAAHKRKMRRDSERALRFALRHSGDTPQQVFDAMRREAARHSSPHVEETLREAHAHICELCLELGLRPPQYEGLR